MNFKIVLNIQWLFFILFYGCCSGDVGGVGKGAGSSGNDYYNKEVPTEVTRSRRFGARINRTREFNERSEVLSQLDRVLASLNQSEPIEEHERFEVARKKDGSKSSQFGGVGKGVIGDRKKWNVDDYEYKIANHQGGRRPGEATWAEIDDKGVNGKYDRDLAERKHKSSERPARKLLSIEADPVAVDDRDDTVGAVEASDYGVVKQGLLTATSEFNGDDDDLEEHKQSRGRRWGSRPNRANQDRRRRQEMDQQRRVDSRKSGRAADDTDGETISDKSTVYRQRYPPVAVDEEGGGGEKTEEDPGAPEVIESTTVPDACDCVAKCAAERVLQEAETSTEESSADTGDNDEVTTEEIEQDEGEEEVEEEEDDDEQEEQEEEEPEEEQGEEKELTTKETTSGAESGASKQREVYIDLKIGIKSVGNESLSEDSEPLEFHKKILVKREKIGEELRYQLQSFQQQQQQEPSSATHFPISLVKAIYQLVDRSDSLRTHVAPRLPARSKVLSKLQQSQRRAVQKINDRQQRGPQHQRGSGPRTPKKNSKGVDKVVAVIDALKELIQQ